MSLYIYAYRLSKAVVEKNEDAFGDICLDLECSQLENDFWPPDIFDFFIDALNNETICAMDGSCALLGTLSRDFEKLTQEQSAELFMLFDLRADTFSDEMLRHSISNMIAYMYPPEMGMELFTKWKMSSFPRRQHMAQVGFEVLLMAERLNKNLASVACDHLQELWQRK
ncbi:hypothetical protein [Verminephrobacter aporrectodeae]|nr:hypothetical protein [Verminephrobacter aporrectodeae]